MIGNDSNEINLSICIATFERCDFIRETLDSIIMQVVPGVDIIVVDGASTDNTSVVMAEYCARHPVIAYYREEENSGIDGDYDKAVGYANGKYCWLFADDDLMAPGAIERVMGFLDGEVALVAVDAEVRTVDFSRILEPRRLAFSGVREYAAEDGNGFMADAGNMLSFIGTTIIRRDIWLARDRQSYYGTLFIHVGVIFQKPLPGRAVVIGEPLIMIRLGNAMWTARSFEIWMFKWPELIWSFDKFSAESRAAVVRRELWKNTKIFVSFKANGAFSLAEYRRFFADKDLGWRRPFVFGIALVPGPLVHVLTVLYIVLFRKKNQAGLYNLLHGSRHANWLSRLLVGIFRGASHAA